MDRTQITLKDYEANCGLIANYSSMRMAALGGGLAVLGVLVSVSSGAEHPTSEVSVLGLILLIVFALLRVIGAINRNLHTRCLHLAELEKKMNHIGFYRCWHQLVIDSPKGLSSHGFVVMAHILNIASIAFVLVSIFLNFGAIVFVGSATVCALLLIINTIYVKSEICPSGFVKTVNEQLLLARAKLGESKQNLACGKSCSACARKHDDKKKENVICSLL